MTSFARLIPRFLPGMALVLLCIGVMSFPAAGAPETNVQGTAAAASASDVTALDLYTAVTRARVYHPDVLDAVQAVEAAGLELENRLAAFTPRASVSGTPVSLRWSQGEMRASPASLRLSASQTLPSGLSASAGITVRLPLDDFSLDVQNWNVSLSYPLLRSAELNANNLSVRQAEINLQSARANLARTEARAVIATIEQYYDALAAKLRLEQARSSLTEAEEQYEAVSGQHELGIASDVDLLNAETELLRQGLALAQAERAYHNQMEALAKSVGLTYSPFGLDLAPAPELKPPDVEIDAAAWRERVLEHDPALWQREVAVTTAELQLAAEKERQRLESSIEGTISRGRTSTDGDSSAGSGSGSAADTSINWSVQVQFSYPLLDGGARRNSLREREEDLANAVEALAEERKAAERRFEALLNALHDARVEAEVARLQYAQAEIEWQAAEARYARGLTNEREVNRALRALQNARADEQRAILAVYVALWELQLAAGMELDLTDFLTPDKAW